MKKIKGLDLFCGAGGSSLGARAAGVEIVGAIDAWDVAAETYKDNFPQAEVITARLDDNSDTSLFSRVDTVDLLIASPECTHHSIARGAKPRCETSRRSGWYVMPFVRKYEPRWIVLENVSGMRRWDGYKELINELSEHYHLRVQMLDAANFGVPQTRKRLFILGDRLRKPAKILPTESCSQASVILDEPYAWKARPVFGGHLSENTIARVNRGMSELGKGKDFLVVYYGSDRAGGWQPLDRPIRTLTTVDRFGLVRWTEGVATFRMLQVPELRRAMGYPENAKLERGSRRDRVKLLGNGVCPPVMQAAVTSLTSEALKESATLSKTRSVNGRMSVAA
ncbi:DNA cytosine methyltransferase [Gluconobacter sphaericus]|uniref:DNA (cytosine-5-)-methyltransferase n=1 Tax=Gluconobacter sphaericus NBRC 12467 TaxID=1307951 RepID=A0AA37SJ11_9PROT|nr:DNA cytosine methyltransferase [Gluconobacter sphaericus]MBF0886827.1 DNA cytosine methyltransferase [Gluconobacter sphaericus]GBR54984.1 site-specific DNA methylase [Gluconobacter sphaericus NBRC 12467]GEB43751.1 DNA methyltransferase [Gluconobacter sphaericus NBRC 12467]GLQ85676.1 DNA methyltransferase [Gluconobacter sphaericus NBRC 12467]